MKLLKPGFTVPPEQSVLRGPLRADRRTKSLTKRLRPGDVAVIWHTDLDSTAARALAEARPIAVVNVVRSISGKYPNRGPAILLAAGIPLLDSVGEEFFASASTSQGQSATVQGGCITLASGESALGEPVTNESLAFQMEAARANIGRELDQFARNTLAYLTEEQGLLIDPLNVPSLKTKIQGRHAMVVVRGEGYKEDLRAIEPYLRDVRPVLIGVDGGADALLEVGLCPDIIIGDMDSISDSGLRCGAELIVHGYTRGGRLAPGLERLERLGLECKVFHAPGTSEDIAMLLADEQGATLIVAVGTHFALDEFLDKGRGGMASTFLVRLRIGSKLVDAKGIGRLWAERSRPYTREILLLVAAALFPLGVVAYHSPLWRTFLNTIRLTFRSTLGLH